MKKQWLLACMSALLMAHTSCVTDEVAVEATSVEARSCMVEEQVQNLIQQVRHGDTEAYKVLALCYRDGNGIRKSYVNAMFMYNIYCHKTGKGLENLIELFAEDHPGRLLIEIMMSSEFDERTEVKLKQLQQIAPEEVKWIEALRTHPTNMLEVFQEAEDEGSELAGIVQAFHYMESKDTINYEQCLTRLAEKHPFLYTEIALIHNGRYDIDNGFSHIQKALQCYHHADSLGMLSPRKANELWSIYDYFSQKGLVEYNEIEVERLKQIMKTEYEM